VVIVLKQIDCPIYFITGAAGFIGSNLAHYLVSKGLGVVAIDKLTYAGNMASLDGIPDDKLKFVKCDICDGDSVYDLLKEIRPAGIFHLAAESHVDRSIDGPSAFIETNIVGTYSLLEAVRKFYEFCSEEEKKVFRFLHVSTDEVFGSLGNSGYFTEETRYAPNSPYSATKASADHLVRAWHITYGIPVLTTNCSNNYGPRQFPEKLIPLLIHNALKGKELPVYGDGKNVRDWLYVEDHCSALYAVMTKGGIGQTYNIGGGCERQNIEIAKAVCGVLDEINPRSDGKKYEEQITFVKDRPGHDRRYAIDSSKIRKELGWQPTETFESGIRKTVLWYLDNPEWVQDIIDGTYQCQRLGLGGVK